MSNNILDKSKPIFTIGIAADMVGVSVHTLRMYEKAGLLCPHRTITGRRLYSITDIKLLYHIRALIKERGLNLAGIKALWGLIPCWEIRKCTDDVRTVCGAFTKKTGPCWGLKVNLDFCLTSHCGDCIVYELVAQSQDIKTMIYGYS